MKIISLFTVVAIALIGVPASAATSGTTPAPSCVASITTSCNITDGDTASQKAQLDECCTALSDAVDNQRKCFCSLQPYLADTPSDTAAADQLFTYCSIDGSFDTLCPTDGSTSPSDDGTTPSEDSSSGVPATPSSGSSTGNGLGLGGGVLGQAKAKSGGNKMASTSISGLLITFIALVVMRGI
ncbi:hypothetical protein KSS87_013039 [Heliosperma pusillum]|nr:hypothetical protein KSS87_011402 [Heliosperma pusillum]KAH9619196.1 hypothetical protein KSS87_013039 [Heliosperma pusillum]